MNCLTGIEPAPEKRQRKALDLYGTPADVALACCRRIGADIGYQPGEIIEPSAGPAAFVRAARATWPHVAVNAVDIDGAHGETCLAVGAASFIESDWPTQAAQWNEVRRRAPRESFLAPLLIVGNPPFSAAEAHIAAAIELLRHGELLAFILRMSFLGAQDRIDFFQKYPPLSVAVILPRPPYDGEGGDNADSCLFIWQKGRRGLPVIEDPILWGRLAGEREAKRKQMELMP